MISSARRSADVALRKLGNIKIEQIRKQQGE
jgi:hypothetical protein